MRWLMLGGTVVAFMLCFTRHSSGAMGFWLMLGLVGTLVTALAFVQTRISARSRESSLSDFDLQRLREGKPPLER